MLQIISTENAPAAIGPYNQAVRHANTLYCSGQIGLIPATGELADGLEAQVRQAFSNLRAVVAEAGAEFNQVVKFTLFVTDINNFALVNSIMSEYVAQPYPARSCVEVSALPKGALFEIEAIVALA
ncbi:MAG: RidA family protein [Duodenibacillus sp.]|jgi:reactive intermediate/imine deaminase|nr:RidA family protein [Duodenibacillus sp.]